MAKEAGFRPTTFDDFSGQDKIKRMLKIYIKAAQMKNEQLDHILIAGPSGVLGTLEFMDVDANGFNAQDRAYLTKLYTSKKAVGVDSLVMELGVDKKSIETVIEPYLLQEQFIVKTPRGRELC